MVLSRHYPPRIDRWSRFLRCSVHLANAKEVRRAAPTARQAVSLSQHAYEHGQVAEAEQYLLLALALTRQERQEQGQAGDRQAEKEILI